MMMEVSGVAASLWSLHGLLVGLLALGFCHRHRAALSPTETLLNLMSSVAAVVWLETCTLRWFWWLRHRCGSISPLLLQRFLFPEKLGLLLASYFHFLFQFAGGSSAPKFFIDMVIFFENVTYWSLEYVCTKKTFRGYFSSFF